MAEPSICQQRFSALSAAVELGVDEDEFDFHSEEEQLLWQSLRQEFQDFVSKIGPVWIADG
ncbi:MAG: hypothetical protein ACR2QK_10065 [Acidimicrobiales bacterium]